MDRKNIALRGSLFGTGPLTVVFVAMLAMVALAWAGGKPEPWKTKPYTEWDQNDLKLILNDSPWAKLDQVEADWRTSKGGEETAAAPPAGGMPVNRPYGAGNAPGQSMAYFDVRWYSSRTIREAIVRNAILAGQVQDAAAEHYLAQTPADYQIAVAGPDMTPFASAGESTLKAKTYLEAKQSKQKASPSSVTFQRTPDGKTITAVVFSFSKQTASGQPLIAAKDKQVQFVCKVKHLDLNTGFDLRKMTDQKGPDF
ncbi:MAG TPA: hypothetical protein VNE63_12640 [Candidatus Acidoferrales bacterium]|nr:hypothetical protein [Candidatus Acidoferrales bacterium]